MFKSNSRIENNNGIRFYEQDIIFDDYVYHGNMSMTVTVDYASPGFGVSLINNEGSSLDEMFLFRIGYKECSIVHKANNIQTTLKRNATTLKPYESNLKIHLVKNDKKITMSVDGYGTILEYTLKKSIDTFNVALYSNAGNTVKDINIASSIPDNWNINMHNTKGGYIKFFKDGFELTDCIENAEVEQQNIALSAGTYYIHYDTKPKNDKFDISCFVFSSDSPEIYDDKKNLLVGNTFTLTKNSSVNIKFKGTNGLIEDIQLTDDNDDAYVGSLINQVKHSDPSYINILLKLLKRIEIEAVLTSVPDDSGSEQFYIASNTQDFIEPADLGVNIGDNVLYVYDVENQMLEAYIDKNKIASVPLKAVTNLFLFKNINSVITRFDLIRRDGQVINLVVNNINRKYVPASIHGPIIALSAENTPLNLSSSYRTIETDGVLRYVFTNIEREYFDANSHIKTDSPISYEAGSVKVYGILNDVKVDFDNLLKISEEGKDSIDLFCKYYEIIYEDDLLNVNKNSGDIFIEDVSKYQMLVVDYLKEDSYCINYNPSLKVYEVDISSETDVSLMYEHDPSLYGDKVFNEIESYNVTGIKPENSCYIVLRTSNG
jgi:hypothetical protein